MAWCYRPLTVPDQSDPPVTKPRLGFLSCEVCKRSIPYTGLTEMDMATAPQHKCAGYQIRPFTRWTAEDVTRPPLGQAGDSPLEKENTP